MNSDIANNLFLLARIKGLTKTKDGSEEVNQLAIQKITGVPQTTISGIITQGKIPRIDTLEKLAKGLEINLWQLLSPAALFKASLEPGFAQMITNYAYASEDGQAKIRLVAASQAVLADTNL